MYHYRLGLGPAYLAPADHASILQAGPAGPFACREGVDRRALASGSGRPGISADEITRLSEWLREMVAFRLLTSEDGRMTRPQP
jgi:hypothetical protein